MRQEAVENRLNEIRQEAVENRYDSDEDPTDGCGPEEGKDEEPTDSNFNLCATKGVF